MDIRRRIARIAAVAVAIGSGLAGAHPAMADAGWSPGPGAMDGSTLDGFVDEPAAQVTVAVGVPLKVAGWVVDTTAQGWAGVDEVHVYAGRAGEGGTFLTRGSVAQPRPDVAAAMGNGSWANAGFVATIPAGALQPGARTLAVYAHTPSRGWWFKEVTVHAVQAGFATPADRAMGTFAAMQRYLGAGRGLFRETYPADAKQAYSFNWPFSRAFLGALDLLGVPRVGETYRPLTMDARSGSEVYWDAQGAPPAYASAVLPPLGPGGDVFFDDNAWDGLAAVQLYRLTGDQAALDRARKVFDLLVSGWDADASHPAPGGVFWVKAAWNRDRGVVSNAPSAELALHLYELGGRSNPAYLDWAKKMLGWTDQTLRAPNGLYWDRVDLAGNVDRTFWSYNQGTTIGANVLLYRTTGDVGSLDRAKRIADAALDYYVHGGRLIGQPPSFNAIFFRNLLLLQAETGDAKYRQAIQTYADRVWAGNRDPATGLFRFDASGRATLLDQGAMLQVFALLGWDPGSYRMIA